MQTEAGNPADGSVRARTWWGATGVRGLADKVERWGGGFGSFGSCGDFLDLFLTPSSRFPQSVQSEHQWCTHSYNLHQM
jgi:hypothetical protein